MLKISKIILYLSERRTLLGEFLFVDRSSFLQKRLDLLWFIHLDVQLGELV